MKIGKNHKIESDSLNVTLYRREVGKKDKSIRWRPIAYFSNVTNVLDHIVDMGVAETGLKDFQVVVEKQKELYQLIRSLQNSSEMLQRVRR